MKSSPAAVIFGFGSSPPSLIGVICLSSVRFLRQCHNVSRGEGGGVKSEGSSFLAGVKRSMKMRALYLVD